MHARRLTAANFILAKERTGMTDLERKENKRMTKIFREDSRLEKSQKYRLKYVGPMYLCDSLSALFPWVDRRQVIKIQH